MLDLSRPKAFIAEHPPPGELLFCAVTGSHIYGFPSEDSDVDLKGGHLAPTASLLGLSPQQASHERLLFYEGVEMDLTTNELGKVLALMLAGNGNMLERIFSPLQLVETDDLEALRALTSANLSAKSAHHYRGFMQGKMREHVRDGQAKSLLYTFRIGLTGIHLLTEGEVISDVTELAPRYGFDDVLALVELKRAQREKDALAPAISERFQGRWPALEARLERAVTATSLPDAPTETAQVEQWLINRRLQALSQR